MMSEADWGTMSGVVSVTTLAAVDRGKLRKLPSARQEEE